MPCYGYSPYLPGPDPSPLGRKQCWQSARLPFLPWTATGTWEGDDSTGVQRRRTCGPLASVTPPIFHLHRAAAGRLAIPQSISKPTVDMNKASVLDLVCDKDHDTKPSAMPSRLRTKVGRRHSSEPHRMATRLWRPQLTTRHFSQLTEIDRFRGVCHCLVYPRPRFQRISFPVV